MAMATKIYLFRCSPTFCTCGNVQIFHSLYIISTLSLVYCMCKSIFVYVVVLFPQRKKIYDPLSGFFFMLSSFFGFSAILPVGMSVKLYGNGGSSGVKIGDVSHVCIFANTYVMFFLLPKVKKNNLWCE